MGFQNYKSPGAGYTDTDVANYLAAQGISANGSYDYIQQTKPSSPSPGERWLELDVNGNVVQAWFVEDLGTHWLSIDTQFSLAGATSLFLTGSSTYDDSVPYTEGNVGQIWVEGIFLKTINVATMDGSNNWTFAMQSCDTTAGAQTTLHTFTVNTGGANNIQEQYQSLQTLNEACAFRVTTTKVGTSNIRASFGFVLRQVKSVA